MSEPVTITKSPTKTNRPTIDLAKELTSGFAHKFIRHKTRQLIGRYGLRSADRPDLDQDMKLLLLRRFEKFDPEISDWQCFVITVIERQVATILQKRRRLKRRGLGKEVSLADDALDEDGVVVEIADLVSPDDLAAITRVFHRPETEWFELEEDLATVLARLPDQVREICEWLKHQSVLASADAIEIPRTTLLYLLDQLREQFTEQGISDFL